MAKTVDTPIEQNYESQNDSKNEELECPCDLTDKECIKRYFQVVNDCF